MSYSKKKEKLIELREDILRDYERLLAKALTFGNLSCEIAEGRRLPHEQVDFVNFMTNDVSTMKTTSLISALLYVEFPENREVVDALIRDIEINRKGRRKL